MMLLKEKGKKDAEPISMGWDEAQSAIAAGTHIPADGGEGDQPKTEKSAKPEADGTSRRS